MNGEILKLLQSDVIDRNLSYDQILAYIKQQRNYGNFIGVSDSEILSYLNTRMKVIRTNNGYVSSRSNVSDVTGESVQPTAPSGTGDTTIKTNDVPKVDITTTNATTTIIGTDIIFFFGLISSSILFLLLLLYFLN